MKIVLFVFFLLLNMLSISFAEKDPWQDVTCETDDDCKREDFFCKDS